MAEGTQAGVLHKMTTRAKVQNTPLNVEAPKQNVQGQGTRTSRENIEAKKGICKLI